MTDRTNGSEPKKTRRIRGSGSIFRKGNSRVWTVQYFKNDPATGRRVRVREATGLSNRTEAQNLLTDRLDRTNKGEIFETRRMAAVRVEELFNLLKTENLNNGKTGETEKRWAHLSPVFGPMIAVNLSTEHCLKYTRKRQEEGAANATINRELATLRRMFNLGRRCTPPKVRATPYIPMLKEDNVRRGFVEDADFARLTAEASELWLRTYLEIGYTLGWRKGELLGLRVRQVDLAARVIRLDPGTTKNREGRECAMTGKVAELLLSCVTGKKPDAYVLTRPNGQRVCDVRDAWQSLCVRAGLGEFLCKKCGEPWAGEKCECGSRDRRYKGLIPHDLRRSAAKSMRRAGVPESVIMAMGGWKTPAMFRRYAIVSSADQRAAIEKVERARAKTASAPVKPPFNPEATAPVPRRAARQVN